MEKKKKNIVIGVTSLLLVTLILLGLTYAYYKTRIVGNTSDKSVSVVSKNLSVTYQNESAEISATGIEPGYSATKTFEVKSTGSETVEYSVMLDNVTNTFARTEDWTYTISESGTKLKSGTLPASTSYILYSESIDAGATKSYTLTINYADSIEDQSEDMGKSLSFRINLNDDLGTTLTSAEEGTLLYAINRDNVVSEPLSVPGITDIGVASYSEETSWKESSGPYFSDCYQWHPNNEVQIEYYNYVYGTGYTFDEKTGKYTLTGVTIGSTKIKDTDLSELNGKYFAVNRSCTPSNDIDISLYNSTPNGALYIANVNSEGDLSFQMKSARAKANYMEENAIFASTEDDYGTSYYYRGDVLNNYVTYSNMCWRIVRVQGDGTIKLVLADENHSCGTVNGYSINDSSSAFVDRRTDIKYNNTDMGDKSLFLFDKSNIPAILNEWAIRSEKVLDTSKLVEAEWCNDTALVKKYFPDHTRYYYGALNALDSSHLATLKCNTKGMEGTTGIDVNAQKYKNKFGVLSALEVEFAGSGLSYLPINANSHWYWTMSPDYVGDEIYYAHRVSSNGYLYSSDMGEGLSGLGAVRPSIVLASTVTISSTTQDGTMDNPYVIN